MPTSKAVWVGQPERLDRAMPALKLVRSRSHANELIARKLVHVNGQLVNKAGVLVKTGNTISVPDGEHYVSRGAYKLIAALDHFHVDPAGKMTLDLGASTGGFTQVLLERGAETVLAVDVGHNQFAPQLRTDPRVRVVEGCNARSLDPSKLATLTGVTTLPALVVADLSFISLTLILPAMRRVSTPGTHLLLLIKPQFEVGRVREGVVNDPVLWREAILKVLNTATGYGFTVRGLTVSPLTGSAGNREFLAHLTRENPGNPQEWEERVDEVCAQEVTLSEGSNG